MKCYKLMKQRKDGSLGSLFINAKEKYQLNKWMDAEFIPTKGFADRYGWHCTLGTANAPHLKRKLSNGEKRVWVEVEVEDVEYYNRPESQGGTWVLAKKMKINKVLCD